MRSRVSVTGSAAAGPSLRARRHNLNEPRKQSFPCFLRPPQALCQQAQNVPHGTATVDTVLAMVSRTASWRVSAFDRLDEPTGESTSELLHCHDLDATRFPSRGFHARHVARKSGVHHNCAARRHCDLLNQGSGKSEPVALLHVKAYYTPASLCS
jgi:hypothetical protein